MLEVNDVSKNNIRAIPIGLSDLRGALWTSPAEAELGSRW